MQMCGTLFFFIHFHDCVQDKENKQNERKQLLCDIMYLCHLSFNRCILCYPGLMNLCGNSESATAFLP